MTIDAALLARLRGAVGEVVASDLDREEQVELTLELLSLAPLALARLFELEGV